MILEGFSNLNGSMIPETEFFFLYEAKSWLYFSSGEYASTEFEMEWICYLAEFLLQFEHPELF